MTVSEYSTLKEISVQAVYKRIKSKKLEKKTIGNFIFVKEITD